MFEVPSCMFPLFRHPVMPHSAQALSKLCPSPPFLSKLATNQCRDFKFLLLSGVCESHNSGIQSLVATFGGLRVPQIRPLVTSHLVQSLSDPFCPITLQALSKLCPSRVFEVPSCMFPIFRHPVMPHSDQALSKLCPSPPISVQASHQTMSGIQVLATFGGL